MQYTYLGHTGVKVSRLCLGCMSYGDPQWRPWVLDERAAMPFFAKAVEAGINFFDTADVYSLGSSEEITGKALRQYAKLEQVVLATKVFNRVAPGPNMKGLSRKHVQQGCEASLRRLGVETIDLYQVHRFDWHTPLDEMLAALDFLVHQGKVRYIGASSAAAWQFAQALSLSERNGWARFVSMQNHYNLIYREEEREMIPLCQAEGIAVIPWSPLARGLLAGTRKAPDDKTATAVGQRRVRLDAVRSSGRRRRDAGLPAGGGPPRHRAGPGRPGVALVQAGRDGADRRRHEARASGDGHCRA